jgi:hypothetical protein
MEQGAGTTTAALRALPDSGSFNADDTLVSLESAGRRRVAAAVSVFALMVYAAYLTYRAAFTLNPNAIVL